MTGNNKSHFKITIIGRTNVGKTTFFNKFCEKKLGIVSDFSGLTRDINSFKITINNCNFEILDTPGFEKDSIFFNNIQKQYFNLIQNCDLIMFFVDGKSGFLDEERNNLNKIKTFLDKTILVINKCENEKKIQKESFENLPFSQVFKISSEHLNGFKELYSYLFDLYREKGFELNFSEKIEKKRIEKKAIIRDIEKNKKVKNDKFDKENLTKKQQIKKNNRENYEILESEKSEIEKTESEKEIIKISVIGRPNAGKSTFLNKILGENRLCVSEIAGTTRDSVRIPFEYKKYNKIFNLEFVDTAGIRKKSKINDDIEKMSVQESIKNLDLANVVLFMSDIENILEFQDLKLINLILKEGRILILLINKWDKVKYEKSKDLGKEINKHLVSQVSQVKGLNFFTISAINDKNFNPILDECIKLFSLWKRKIPSKDLNTWLNDFNFTPFISERKLKLKFIKQTNIKPQKFTIFSNFTQDDIPSNHYNYIRNELIKAFNLYGVPIRIEIKKQKNPFEDKLNKK